MDQPTNPFGPPSLMMSGAGALDSKTMKVPPNKKRTRRKKSKKPKDMPRRPLSAYNIFFKEERSRLLKEIENGNDVLGTQDNTQGLFALMGKSIAKKWKSLSKEEMVKYTDAAKEDLKRYRSEMDEYQILVTQKCRVEEEQKSEEDDFNRKPTPIATSSLSMQQQGLMLDGPQAYNRLRELQGSQLREASHQTDVSRLLAAGRPDLASQLAMGGLGTQSSMLFAGMQGMPLRGEVGSGQQQQQQGDGGGDDTANRSNVDLSQQLGVSGPQMLQYLQEDALRRQLERERQIQLEILLRQQQQYPGSGMSNDQAMMMLMMQQQQQQQRGATGLNPSGTLGGLPNQQLQFLMMQQQLQQQQLQQQQQQQLGQGSIQQQAQQHHGDEIKANDEAEAIAEGSAQLPGSEDNNGGNQSPSGSEDYEYGNVV